MTRRPSGVCGPVSRAAEKQIKLNVVIVDKSESKSFDRVASLEWARGSLTRKPGLPQGAAGEFRHGVRLPSAPAFLGPSPAFLPNSLPSALFPHPDRGKTWKHIADSRLLLCSNFFPANSSSCSKPYNFETGKPGHGAVRVCLPADRVRERM